MSEYIISIPDERFPDAYRDVYYPDERHDPMPIEEIVYCRDCKNYMDYEHEFEPNLGYCYEHDREEVRDSWFCSWAKRR